MHTYSTYIDCTKGDVSYIHISCTVSYFFGRVCISLGIKSMNFIGGIFPAGAPKLYHFSMRVPCTLCKSNRQLRYHHLIGSMQLCNLCVSSCKKRSLRDGLCRYQTSHFKNKNIYIYNYLYIYRCINAGCVWINWLNLGCLVN